MKKLFKSRQNLLSVVCVTVACAAALSTAGASVASSKAIKPIPRRNSLNCNDPCLSSSQCTGSCKVCHPLNSNHSVCYTS